MIYFWNAAINTSVRWIERDPPNSPTSGRKQAERARLENKVPPHRPEGGAGL